MIFESARWRQWPRWLLLIIAVVAGAILLSLTVELVQFLHHFNGAVDLLAGRYGFNRWLAKALALVIAGALGWTLHHGLFGVVGSRRKKGWTRIVAIAFGCLFFLGIWSVDRQAYFAHDSGQVLKWWSIDTEGQIRLYDSPGFDTVTGQPLQEATAEIVLAYSRQQEGRRPAEVPIETFLEKGGFDANTGQARVWFARQPDGGFALFDGPGFDPETQHLLEPMNPQVTREILLWARETESRRAQEMAEQQQAQRANVVAAARARSAAEAAAFRSRYVDEAARAVPGAIDYCIRVTDARSNVEEIESALRQGLQARGFRVLPVFKPEFTSEGLAQQLFEGGPTLTKKLALARSCDVILLGHLRTTRSPQDISGLVLTEVALDLRTISPTTGLVDDEVQFRQKGGGLNAGAAFDDAVRKVKKDVKQQAQHWPG